MRDTKNAFYQLQKTADQELVGNEELQNHPALLHVERMRGLYSYNVLDSPDYIQAKKIERRIAIYDRKMREKQRKKAEETRKETLENMAKTADYNGSANSNLQRTLAIEKDII